MPTSGARVNIEEMRPARSVLTDTYWLQDGGYWHFSLLASNFDLFFIVMALLSVAKKNKKSQHTLQHGHDHYRRFDCTEERHRQRALKKERKERFELLGSRCDSRVRSKKLPGRSIEIGRR